MEEEADEPAVVAEANDWDEVVACRCGGLWGEGGEAGPL